MPLSAHSSLTLLSTHKPNKRSKRQLLNSVPNANGNQHTLKKSQSQGSLNESKPGLLLRLANHFRKKLKRSRSLASLSSMTQTKQVLDQMNRQNARLYSQRETQLSLPHYQDWKSSVARTTEHSHAKVNYLTYEMLLLNPSWRTQKSKTSVKSSDSSQVFNQTQHSCDTDTS